MAEVLIFEKSFQKDGNLFISWTFPSCPILDLGDLETNYYLCTGEHGILIRNRGHSF